MCVCVCVCVCACVCMNSITRTHTITHLYIAQTKETQVMQPDNTTQHCRASHGASFKDCLEQAWNPDELQQGGTSSATFPRGRTAVIGTAVSRQKSP